VVAMRLLLVCFVWGRSFFWRKIFVQDDTQITYVGQLLREPLPFSFIAFLQKPVQAPGL
jgi:hypothetical protein